MVYWLSKNPDHMTIRRNLIILSVFILCVSFASAAWAQPNGFGAITPEKIAELESMHQQAIDFLIKNDFQGAVRTYSDILLMEPDDETAYTGLGQIYMVQGRYKLANEAFKNALNINGENQVALAGIRRIMDPDGLEGMVSKPEVEAEAYVPLAAPQAAPLSVASAPQAGMAKRQSAVKAKKDYVSPVPAATPLKKRSFSSAHLGRLGLLHAQRAQMALRRAGFYKGPVNGMVGPVMKSSIRDFQKNFGIVSNGKLTPVTLTKLSEYLSI